jgi:glucosyl-dolichyl phosphate glucuronosyltransferase
MTRDPVAEIDVSVMVCTRDRARSLTRLLESACALTIPPGIRWEMVVVDNGSRDETQAAIGRFAAKLPIRFVVEPVPGHSRARNRGAAEVRGRYVCCTDDDTELDPGWLEAYCRAFQRHPEAALFGGRILPRLAQPQRHWFARGLKDWPLAAVTARRDPRAEAPIRPNELPWGANFAIRAADQRRLGYDPTLGPSFERQRIADETDLFYRLLAEGGEGWWVPGSLVWHHIGEDRQSRAHIRRYFRIAGETAAQLHSQRPGDNANETDGRRAWAAVGSPVLVLLWGAAVVMSALARALGRDRMHVRMLARQGLYRGILDHRWRPGEAASGGLHRMESRQ